MIESAELRIGNLITIRGNHRIRRVDVVHKLGVTVIMPCGFTSKYRNEKLMPILLTDTILVDQMGFKRNGVTYSKNQYILWLLGVSEGYAFMLYDERDGIRGEDFTVYSKTLCHIRHLHHLQNVWFNLVRQELEINLP